MLIFTGALRNALLGSDYLAHALTNTTAGASSGTGSMFTYLFAGTVPVDADTALNLSTTHTALGKISSNAGGGTGCTLTTPSGGVIAKNASETWSTGNMTFSGFGATGGTDTLTATFFRICEGADNGQGSGGSNMRIQGTIGAIGAGIFDMLLSSTSLTEGNNFVLAAFQLNLAN